MYSKTGPEIYRALWYTTCNWGLLTVVAWIIVVWKASLITHFLHGAIYLKLTKSTLLKQESMFQCVQSVPARELLRTLYAFICLILVVQFLVLQFIIIVNRRTMCNL